MLLLVSGKGRDRVFALSRINCFNPKLLMRVSLLSVAFLTCLVTLGGTTSGQSLYDKISVRYSDIPLKKALRQLEKQTGFNFTWRSIDIDNAARVNLILENRTVAYVLSSLLKPTMLQYTTRGSNIVVYRNPASDGSAFRIFPAPERLISVFPMVDTVPALLVKGRVTSSEKLGEPVPNASVTLKGTRIGTITDPDGNFTLRIPRAGRILVVTQVSFETVEVVAEASGPTIVNMKPRAQAMTEVVTTGLYKRPKESFTGAATTISGDQVRAVSMTNALQAIKNFDPSIRIPDNVQFGSDPNRMPKISIRGTNNFPTQGTGTALPPSGADFMASYATNPNQPIFILDGFEVSLQKIYDLDINRIASFTILKDASATSMYGSRAANGVIIVDTKQPAQGKIQVSYSGTANLAAPDLSVYNLLNASEKVEVEKIAGVYTRYKNESGSGAALDAYWRNYQSLRESYVAKGINTDWLSVPLRNAVGSNHSINLGGGDNSIRYQINMNYKNDPGVMKGSKRDVYSGDMMISYRFRGFSIRNAMSLTYNKGMNSPYGSFSDYSRQNSYWKPYDENGAIVKILEDYGDEPVRTNPLWNSTLNVVDQSEYTLLNNNTELEWLIGNGFRLSGNLGLTRQIDESNVFLPASHTSFAAETNFLRRGSYDRTYAKFLNIQSRITLNYSHRVGRGHLFNTTLVEMNQNNRNGMSIRVEGFPNENLNDIFFGNGYPVNSKPSGYTDITRRLSAGDNFSFTWNQRYVVEGSLRMDGSSQFGNNRRYAAFWSLGGSWNLHKENFVKSHPEINLFRIRASIGSTGDDRFPTSQAITTYQYYTSSNFHGLTGTNLVSYGNPDLTWQQGLKKNIGLDLTLFNNRFQLQANLYNETTKSLVLDINTPPSVGVSSYKQNGGKLQNNGFEFNINAIILQNTKQGLYWTVFVNGTHNKSKIVEIANSLKKLNEQADATANNKQVSPQLRYVEGFSPNAIWGVRSLGIDPSTGREMFLNRFNQVTYTWDPKDKVIIGDPTGGMFGNFGSSLAYKGFTIAVYCNYQTSIDSYNQTLASRIENLNLTWQGDKRVLYGRWKKPGDITFFKGLTDENGYSVSTLTNVTSRFIQKDNYININSISLGYQLPDRITKKMRLQTTRVTLIANEIKRWGSIEMERGLDYPFARAFSFNLSCNF